MLSIINETWKKLPRCGTEKTMRQSGRLRTEQKRRVQESASHSKTPFGEIVARLEDGNAQKIGMYGCKMKGYQGISGWGLQMPRRKRRPHPTRDQLQMDRQIPLSAWKVEDGQRMGLIFPDGLQVKILSAFGSADTPSLALVVSRSVGAGPAAQAVERTRWIRIG